MAGLQGIDLEEAAYKRKMKEIKERAQSKIHGEHEWDSMSLSELGMFFEPDESEEEGSASQ